MLIRIKQIRKLENGDPGTDIILGKGKNAETLQFRPLDEEKPDRDHACDVTDSDHLSTLLAIKEGFEIHPNELKTSAGKALAARAAAAAKAAASESGGSIDELSDDDLAAELERRRAAKAEAAKPAADAGADEPDTGPDIEKMSRQELLAAVKEKTGRAPNPSTSTAKLKAALLAD